MASLPTELEITAAVAHRRRLQAVRLSGMLENGKDERFDRLTRVAAQLVNVPATLISIIAEDHDLYKSMHWLGQESSGQQCVTGRTLCHYGLLMAGPLVINDVMDHPEFRNTVAFDLGIRAYLGIPLVTDDGEHIGSFCAVDLVPREWSQRDIGILSELAYSTLREIKLQRTLSEMARNVELAKHAVQRREELVATVAHDLLGPLQTIMFSAEVLQELPQTTACNAAANPLTRISDSADGMADLLRRLLDEDEPDTGLVTAEFEVVDILDKAKSMMTEIAARNNIRLETSAAANLPLVVADLADLLRIFSNLVGNAIKFSKPNSLVRIAARRDGDDVVFAVSDQGMGIRATDLPKLFTRSWQANPKDGYGYGLGLAICKELVERRHGRIFAESEFGQGSTFSFTLKSAPPAHRPASRS